MKDGTATTPLLDARSASAARGFRGSDVNLTSDGQDELEIESQQRCLAPLERLILGLIEHGGLVATGSAGQVESSRADGREARGVIELGVAGLAKDGPATRATAATQDLLADRHGARKAHKVTAGVETSSAPWPNWTFS